MSIIAKTSSPEIIGVIQGEFAVSKNPNAIMSTVLGSCISACVYDVDAKVGGMNHFLLPESNAIGGQDVKFGAYLMELLINNLLKAGAERQRLRARLAGGGRMNPRLQAIGEQNISFARRYLRNENIPITWESVGGNSARRIRFWPTTGEITETFVSNDPAQKPTRMFKNNKPSVELF